MRNILQIVEWNEGEFRKGSEEKKEKQKKDWNTFLDKYVKKTMKVGVLVFDRKQNQDSNSKQEKAPMAFPWKIKSTENEGGPPRGWFLSATPSWLSLFVSEPKLERQ